MNIKVLQKFMIFAKEFKIEPNLSNLKKFKNMQKVLYV